MTTKIESLVAESIKAHMAKRATPDHFAKREEPVAAAVSETAAVVEEARSITLGPDQQLFSKLFGKAPKDGDFAVTVLKSVPEQVAAHIPVVDKGYVVQIEECADIVRGLEINDRILITGPTGSGKSSLVKHICAKTNRPMVRINMTGDVESSSIFGLLTVEAGATVWKDGAATEAVRYGAVLVNDEWDVTPPEIMFGYQNLMEDNGYLMLKEMPGSVDDKRIIPHDNFRFICCGNTNGQGDDSGSFAGTNVQNTATLNRFGTTVHLDYLEKKHEEKVLKNAFPKLDASLVASMVSYAQLIRQAVSTRSINLTMSPRDLLSWAKKVDSFGYSAQKALKVCYLNKLRENEVPAAEELMVKVFGK